VSTLADPWIFSTSCALIMWAWIYTPDRLPRSYNKWIKSAAAVDQRLLIALRRCRYGEIKYGVETGQAHLLQGMCKHYNWPLEYGDPVKSIPFPCEIVHFDLPPFKSSSHAAQALDQGLHKFLEVFGPFISLSGNFHSIVLLWHLSYTDSDRTSCTRNIHSSPTTD
jgi:hypothetical protein